MSGPCSMCQHFTLDEMPPNLKEAGFGRCTQMRSSSWRYQSQAAACAFSPPRFVAQAVADERPSPAPCDLPEDIQFG